MISISDLQDYWEDELVKVPSTTLPGNLALPQSTIDFLQTIGLPLDQRLNQDPLCHFNFLPEEFSIVSDRSIQYLIIGHSPTLLHCLKENTGEVIARIKDGKEKHYHHNQKMRLANSNVECFLLFIFIYTTYRDKLRIEEGEIERRKEEKPLKILTKEAAHEYYGELRKEWRAAIHEMEQRFSTIDPKALEGDHTSRFWVEIVEAVKGGL